MNELLRECVFLVKYTENEWFYVEFCILRVTSDIQISASLKLQKYGTPTNESTNFVYAFILVTLTQAKRHFTVLLRARLFN